MRVKTSSRLHWLMPQSATLSLPRSIPMNKRSALNPAVGIY